MAFDQILQGISDASSALAAKKQDIADAFAVKNAAISDRDATIATQAATITDLQNQLANAPTPAQIDQAVTGLTTLQSDILDTPTT